MLVGDELTPAMVHILFVLLDQDRHGYGIMKEVENLSDGSFSIGPGTLYRSLDKLEKLRLVRSLGQRKGERRILYRITGAGRSVAAEQLQYLRHLVGALGGASHAATS